MDHLSTAVATAGKYLTEFRDFVSTAATPQPSPRARLPLTSAR